MRESTNKEIIERKASGNTDKKFGKNLILNANLVSLRTDVLLAYIWKYICKSSVEHWKKQIRCYNRPSQIDASKSYHNKISEGVVRLVPTPDSDKRARLEKRDNAEEV